MKKYRLLSILMILTLLLCSCQSLKTQIDPVNSSSSDSSSASKAPSKDALEGLTLYYDNADGFNPYRIQTLTNRTLMPLLYDGLIKLDPSFQPQMKLAQKVTIDGTLCTVLLADRVFSDGSPVTAQDVVFSYEQARSKESLYAQQLRNVTACKLLSANELQFTLKKPDQYFVNNLDFPIVKEDPDLDFTSTSCLPIGSGRYRLSKKAEEYSLVYSKYYFKALKTKPTFKTISLVLLKDKDALVHTVKTGAITAGFEEADRSGLATTGTWTQAVNLNNLLYLGINSENKLLANQRLRQAIFHCIDSNAILLQAYSSRGIASSTPTNPYMNQHIAYNFQEIEGYNPASSKELLKQLGFTSNQTSNLLDQDGKPIQFRLLINTKNNSRYSAAYLIKKMLESVGIQVSIIEKPYKQYLTAIKEKDFDLYLGEVSLPQDMSLDVFFQGKARFGIQNPKQLSALYAQFKSGSTGITPFYNAFYQQIPFVPILFRSGTLIYNIKVKSDVITAPNDIYYNIETWK